MLDRAGRSPPRAGDSAAVPRHTFPTESRMNEENRGYGPGFLLAVGISFASCCRRYRDRRESCIPSRAGSSCTRREHRGYRRGGRPPQTERWRCGDGGGGRGGGGGGPPRSEREPRGRGGAPRPKRKKVHVRFTRCFFF